MLRILAAAQNKPAIAAVAASSTGAVAAHEIPGVAQLVDPALVIACLIGIPIGIAFRVALFLNKRRPAKDIRRDMVISGLAAALNLVLAIYLARAWNADLIEALLLSIALAAAGIKGGVTLIEAVIARLQPTIELETEMGERRQQAAKDIAAARLAQRESKGESDDDGKG